MTTRTARLSNCPNCGAMLDDAFCARCGRKAVSLNPSFGEFLHDLFHELTHVDGKIVQSVRLLLIRPGFLTQEHFEGRRVRYISPIRLYLVFSVLYFAMAAFTPMTAVRVTFTPSPNDPPEQVEARRQETLEAQRTVNEVITHWAPRAMFVLVPIFAGMVALVTRRSAQNYPQHLYFALHVHAAWFFSAAVAALSRTISIPVVTSLISGAALVYGVVYFMLALRRSYRMSIAGAMLRATAVTATYIIVVVATLFALAFPVVRPLFSR